MNCGCKTGKQCYSRSEAVREKRRQVRELHRYTLRVYRCHRKGCKHWHLGNRRHGVKRKRW